MKIPVTLVTGFLGSGKTTLLTRLLAHPDMGETAVIVNELGEVGIDHHLLRRVDERTVLLPSGCLCCALRGDLADELRDLIARRDAGEIPPFRRVVVETTGLANPAPIVFTLLSEPLVKHHYTLEGVVTTVDAQHGLRHDESVLQAAAADTLVDHEDGPRRPRPRDRAAPAAESRCAPVVEPTFGDVAPADLFRRRRPARSARPRVRRPSTTTRTRRARSA